MNRMWCFIGTTAAQAPDRPVGIYACEFDPQRGSLGTPILAAESVMPSFIAIHPSRGVLYATREVADRPGVAAFTIERATGRLDLLNEQASGGAGPCFVGVDATARVLFVANYGDGSVASLPLAPDGSILPRATVIRNHGSSIVAGRQDAAHLHAIRADPTNRFAVACDLGTDQVLIFRFDPVSATLTPHEPPFTKVTAGSGLRHLAFHPSGKHVYTVNELANTLNAFRWDASKGSLHRVGEVTTLPRGYNGETYAAEIIVHPGGRWLYVSNRGHDSIAMFAIDPVTAALAPSGHFALAGRWPRHFTVDPTGRWLIVANEQSDEVIVLRIAEDGRLEAPSAHVRVPSPSCIALLT